MKVDKNLNVIKPEKKASNSLKNNPSSSRKESFYNNDYDDDYDDRWDSLYDELEFDNIQSKRRRGNRRDDNNF